MNQESREDFKNILIERCKFLFAIGTTYAMDAAFLLVWLAIHNGLKRGVEWFAPIGYEKLVGLLLKIILELPTLVTVLVFIISDTKKIIRRITQNANRSSARKQRRDGQNKAKPRVRKT